MTTIERITAADRKIAGKLLAKRLVQHTGSGAVVLGIARGGAIVATSLAEALGLPINVTASRKILNPGSRDTSIGSVTVDDVSLSSKCQDIPRDYISHQLTLIRTGLRKELAEYDSKYKPVSIRYKTVILVDDVSVSGGTLLSCIKSLKKQQPLKIIVAVPFISAKAARLIAEVSDEVIFLRMDYDIKSPQDFYHDFNEVTIADVRNMLVMSTETATVH